ncbi:hypothetical protein Dsin_011731 [Dipteronia sinensis]|uniref:RRM domain-containing protein n=1 Tax=Dipteronia sinensis TaxID=43782 RepID=A0AAE0E7D4_9ROSI|nr:hypothetical protein Dsin_011731 [Dipteronia sinensis]
MQRQNDVIIMQIMSEKEREIARERRHVSLGREGNKVKHNGWDLSRKKDFRENLFSVFIDYLNPKVDVGCLCGVFKVFRKVRDVYLSSKKSSRRSSFAFIRFETQEEAKRAAIKVNGMHIFGWPIVSKIASVGWNHKRFVSGSRCALFKVENESSKGGVGVCYSQFSNHRQRSFMEVLKGDQNRGHVVATEKAEECFYMSWQQQSGVDDWLSRFPVGVLRMFANISSVNRRLNNRGISFASMYLSDKSLLWCFESGVERDRFLRNYFISEDCFISMSIWSNYLVQMFKLTWIKVLGAPLSCF